MEARKSLLLPLCVYQLFHQISDTSSISSPSTLSHHSTYNLIKHALVTVPDSRNLIRKRRHSIKTKGMEYVL